jgi:hypothetical protein
VIVMDEHRDALEHAALALAAEAPLTVALVALRLELSVREAKELLDALVQSDVLELDSLDDGTRCYRAPGLTHVDRAALRSIPRRPATGISRRPSRGAHSIAILFVGFSVLHLLGFGLAALIVRSGSKAELLMYVALEGVPGTLVLLSRWILAMGRLGTSMTDRA